MLLMFAEQLGEARRTGGWLDQAALWARAVIDALTVAPQEHWHVIIQDLRYAVAHDGGAARVRVVAILSLALGIGANTAIFSLWNGVLHAPLPAWSSPSSWSMLSDPDASGRGVAGGTAAPTARDRWLTYAEFEQLREHGDGFSALMASQSSLNTWQVRIDGGAWEDARGRLVSGGFFQVLGVQPAIGRVFTAADDTARTAAAP